MQEGFLFIFLNARQSTIYSRCRIMKGKIVTAKAAKLLKRSSKGKTRRLDEGYSAVTPRNHLAPDLQAMGIGIRRLERLADYRLEMQLVYKALTAGFITEKGGSRLIWILDMMARRKIDEEKLALVKSGQLGGGQPFGGLTIIGPSAAIMTEPMPDKGE